MTTRPGQQVVLVTGAASGLGRAGARHLAAAGHRVFGGDLEDTSVPGVTGLRMDVTEPSSVGAAVDEVVRSAGRFDALVNSAGFGIAGAVEDTSLEEARAQFEVNFFGVLGASRAALPVMRRQGHGRIIAISSIGGQVPLPFQALYSASKFAVEGLMEALSEEVRTFGIDIVLIEPADFRTGFTRARRVVAGAGSDSAYDAAFTRALGVIEKDERTGSDPELIGPLLERIVAARHPRLRYSTGSAVERLTLGLRRVLPSRAFVPLIERHYGVRR
ncbi:MAG: SDR family NAD(P)-dependent oxidoreductase [Brachybacterium paraconglomeratum]|nr:SDR family NAD(P)-dependent oxidoreductase [Brachybacterium paraconglomeratum]